MAWIVLILTFGIVWGGYRYTETKHPYTVPIQAGESKVQPMPVKPNPIAIKVTHANYDVPGRALRVTMSVTNSGDTAYRIGEFTTAGVRFINKVGLKHLDRNYPKELVATGLSFDNDAPIQPGETREVKMEAKDALWEVQRLMALLGDPESRFGGLLMTWSECGRSQHQQHSRCRDTGLYQALRRTWGAPAGSPGRNPGSKHGDWKHGHRSATVDRRKVDRCFFKWIK